MSFAAARLHRLRTFMAAPETARLKDACGFASSHEVSPMQRPSAAFVRFAPFAAFVCLLALRSALARFAGLDSPWLYAVQIGGAAALMLHFRRDYTELRVPAGSPWTWVRAALAGTAVFWIWIHTGVSWMSIGAAAARFEPVGADGSLNWGLITLRLAGAVLVVPAMEELFWRSFLMRWIDRRDFLALPAGQSSLRALLASSGVFALGHTLWFAGLIAGLCYGWIYRSSGKLPLPIAAHALTNLLLGLWVVQHRAWSYW